MEAYDRIWARTSWIRHKLDFRTGYQEKALSRDCAKCFFFSDLNVAMWLMNGEILRGDCKSRRCCHRPQRKLPSRGWRWRWWWWINSWINITICRLVIADIARNRNTMTFCIHTLNVAKIIASLSFIT